MIATAPSHPCLRHVHTVSREDFCNVLHCSLHGFSMERASACCKPAVGFLCVTTVTPLAAPAVPPRANPGPNPLILLLGNLPLTQHESPGVISATIRKQAEDFRGLTIPFCTFHLDEIPKGSQENPDDPGCATSLLD